MKYNSSSVLAILKFIGNSYDLNTFKVNPIQKNVVNQVTLVKVAKTIDIPVGKMKHVEVDGI